MCRHSVLSSRPALLVVTTLLLAVHHCTGYGDRLADKLLELQEAIRQVRAELRPGGSDLRVDSLRPGLMRARSTVSATSSAGVGHFVPPGRREEVGDLLERMGYEVGVELGVQAGHYSNTLMTQWPSCKRFYLVDAWKHQPAYHDFANVDDQTQDKLFEETKDRLKTFENKTVFLRMFTSEAVEKITEPLDFVYVDARHDYCGALEDIQLYWPKIRPGGLMAGHDYHTAAEVAAATNQDWSICMDGTKHPGAVKGAVDEFARSKNLPVFVTYKEDMWHTWFIMKPK